MPNPTLDPSVTQALVEASLAAYNDFAGKPITPPADFRLLTRVTGWDPYLGEEERFGLVFQGRRADNSTQYIVAFRGTDSLSDVLDDALWDFVDFVAHRNSVSPTPDVHQGFYEIYSKPTNGSPSLREQVFNAIPAGATLVMATGHSLGAALAQLFTLDFRVATPTTAVMTINFAAPRVGGTNWRSACDNSGATTLITRVNNYWDYVPTMPPELSGYVNVGTEFQLAFSGATWVAPVDELPRHSLLNLNYVLTRAIHGTPQVWVGTFQDHYYTSWGYTMYSTAPIDSPRQGLDLAREALKDAHTTISTAAANPIP